MAVMVQFSNEIISIHAPTRGATRGDWEERQNTSISIHAPTRGATLELRIAAHYANISILAPTRGATKILPTLAPNTKFQSSLPRGERLRGEMVLVFGSIYFNPRSHEGSDLKANMRVVGATISILAPTRGATEHL